ncbi:hypothetical protein M1D96_06365 [Pseudomonas sp. D1-3]
MNIDWSKAPEDAKGHALIGCEEIPVWVGDSWYEYMDGKRYDFSRSDFELTRPRTQIGQYQEKWNGEGLPPVGLKVEGLIEGNGDWCELTLKYKSTDFSVFERADGEELPLWNPQYSTFRPIRTPDQIAAEERKAEIEAMAKVLGVVACDDYVAATALYDAGYRKQVAP